MVLGLCLEGLGFIEIVKGLGANNVLTESFDRNVLTEFWAVFFLG